VHDRQLRAHAEGEWWHVTHAFGAPIVDYPAKPVVRPRGTITFREEAIPLPHGASRTIGGVSSLRDVRLLPIYAAFNYHEEPFPHSELVRLSEYLGDGGG
jgi:hypothetical protein